MTIVESSFIELYVKSSLDFIKERLHISTYFVYVYAKQLNKSDAMDWSTKTYTSLLSSFSYTITIMALTIF